MTHRGKKAIYIVIALLAVAVVCAGLPRVASAGSGAAAGNGGNEAAAAAAGNGSGTAGSNAADGQAEEELTPEEEHQIWAQMPVTTEEFEKSRPEMFNSKCKATLHSVILKWREVPGAKSYEIVRSETVDGPYEAFAETELPELKEDADGEYYYRVRAVRGEARSRWSLTMRIFSVGGIVEEMTTDKNGYTHFRISISNRTDRPVWLFGEGMYDAAEDPHYRIEHYTVDPEDPAEAVTPPAEPGYPFPLTAALTTAPHQSILIPARTEGQKIDIWVPQTLPRLGETGMRGDTYAYRVLLDVYPDGVAPSFTLTVTEQEKNSKSAARIAH